MFIAYFMAFVLSCETIGLIVVLGIVYRFFSADIVVLYVLPRAPVVSTRSGSTFHPLASMSSIRPLYFTVFSFIFFGDTSRKPCLYFMFVVVFLCLEDFRR
jgi:hypothetical protein